MFPLLVFSVHFPMEEESQGAGMRSWEWPVYDLGDSMAEPYVGKVSPEEGAPLGPT